MMKKTEELYGMPKEDENDKSSDESSEESSEEEENDDSQEDEPIDSFKDEIEKVTSWMAGLTPCQQIVSVLSVISNLSPMQKTFICNHISITKEKDEKNSKKEEQANSLAYWQHVFQVKPNPPKEELLALLLDYLPLLSPQSSPPSSSLTLLYLHMITTILSSASSSTSLPSREFLEKSRELLSLSLISSCFSLDQKKSLLSPFTSRLLLQSNQSNFLHSTMVQEASASSSRAFDAQSPQIAPFSGEGMAGIPTYLKGLRLHKYTPLFASLPSLSHFLNLSEDQLEFLGVGAKGARNKFVQNLAKLRARSSLLQSLFKSGPNEILPALSYVVMTPLSRESAETNLIMHLLLKAKDEMTAEHTEAFNEVLEKCLLLTIWSREQTRLLLEMQANKPSAPAALAVPAKGRVERTCSAPPSSNQLDKQMENLCLAMTEKALNN